MTISFAVATAGDAGAVASLRASVAANLTRRHGPGHWSLIATETGVLRGIKSSRVLLARDANDIVGTVRLATRKPWAINTKYFEKVRRPLYLSDMAVEPGLQRKGVGRRLMREAAAVARAWPADAIRLDAYESAAGAGPFYAKCGYRQVGRVTYRGVPLLYFELLL